MNGQSWDNEFAGELEIDTTEYGDTELGAEDARCYRAIAGRLNYTSPDRPDIGYAVKESARNMSKHCDQHHGRWRHGAQRGRRQELPGHSCQA